MRVEILLVVALLAGCADPDPPVTPPPTTSTPTVSSPGPTPATPPTPAPDDDGWERVGSPVEVSLYLTAQGTLSLEEPSPARFAADATLEDAISSVGAFPGSPWLGPPLDTAWLVTGALLDAQVTLVADGPAASSVSAGIEAADLYAWIGDDLRLVTRNDEIGPEQLAPGAKHTFSTFFFTPHGGLVIPAGGRVAFYALATYVASPQGGLSFQVGGPEATKVTLRAQPIVLSPDPPVVTQAHSEGALDARPPAAGQEEGPNVARIPIDLAFEGREIRRVVIEVDPVATDARRIDLDLFLLAPSGDALFSSLSEFESERIVIFAPNALPDGTYTILVRNTSQVPGGYRLETTVVSS